MKYEYKTIIYECKQCDIVKIVNTDFNIQAPICDLCKKRMVEKNKKK